MLKQEHTRERVAKKSRKQFCPAMTAFFPFLFDPRPFLINKIKNKQDSDGMIYTDTIFIENAIAYMEDECDFDSKLLKEFLDFDYSEQGMQDDEMVNLDVEMDGDFWIKCNDELVKFANGVEKVA